MLNFLQQLFEVLLCLSPRSREITHSESHHHGAVHLFSFENIKSLAQASRLKEIERNKAAATFHRHFPENSILIKVYFASETIEARFIDPIKGPTILFQRRQTFDSLQAFSPTLDSQLGWVPGRGMEFRTRPTAIHNPCLWFLLNSILTQRRNWCESFRTTRSRRRVQILNTWHRS